MAKTGGIYSGYLKRLVDLVLSLSALLVLSPLILLTAIVLFFQNKGSVFFYQERPMEPFNGSN